jgi:hypothetical protein
MSAELLYFGSQTYSEAMFMFLQSALFFLVIRYLVEIIDHFALLFRNWWVVLTVGLLLAFLLIRVSAGCIEKASDNYAILKQNLKGDKYYGYTQDWQNHLKISEWASENIPEGSVIASRKPSMSFIYGNGRHFFGIYNRLVHPSDTVLGILKKRTGRLLP